MTHKIFELVAYLGFRDYTHWATTSYPQVARLSPHGQLKSKLFPVGEFTTLPHREKGEEMRAVFTGDFVI